MSPIIISGGPGAGKTTLLNALGDFGFATFPEGSRTLIEQQSQFEKGVLPWTDLPAFAKLCLELMSEQKHLANQYKTAIVDRAIPDIIGYLKMGQFEVDEVYRLESAGYHSQVFVCRPEASVYVQDDVRPHSYEEALEIHQLLCEVYIELGFEVINVPWGNVEERVEFVKNQLRL